VTALDFSPDGTLLAAGSSDHTVRVFEVKTGTEIAHMTQDAKVQALAFVSEGHSLRAVSGTEDLRVTEGPVRSVDLIGDACSKLKRNLTRQEWADYLSDLPYRKTCELLNPAPQGKAQ
jgi:WD40 repeat protein